jgi:hypothetical protein
MVKSTRPLTGVAKDAWLKRQLAEGGSADDVTRRLQSEIVSLRPREVASAASQSRSAGAPARDGEEAAQAAPGFDPFTPNVVVIVRTRGREAAVAALSAIASADELRLLAREQRLSVDDAPAAVADLRLAIVTAAERRIANRRAAAS